MILPIAYSECLSLMMSAKFVLTDSSGIQEETTALGIPCLTLRDNTERPITITHGTNTIVGNNKEKIIAASKRILSGHMIKAKTIPKYWDGQTATRILDILINRVLIDRSIIP
jgi:UDP-N-acetylglucosamine 2-epimerase (non-hydrolysing)